MNDSTLPIAMAVVTLLGIFLGFPVAWVMAGTAALFAVLADLPLSFFSLLISRIYATALSNWLLVCLPMFILMGYLLERSGCAERTLLAAQRALGPLPGGLSVAVVLIGALLGAASGVVGASVVLLAVLALPEMRKAGYADPLAAGTIAASGTLAILIPPSIMLIVIGDLLRVSVGDLFRAALVPGFLLVFVYVGYVVLRAKLLTQEAPAACSPQPKGSWLTVIGELLPFVALIVAVLGSIIAGVATPTEASGLGALGALLIAASQRKLNRPMLKDATRKTADTVAMIVFIIIGATCFSAVFRAVGGDALIERALLSVSSEAWTILLIIMLGLFFLGFVLDWLEISLILMPIFGPIVAKLDFGNGLSGQSLLIWFAVLVATNLQMSFLTPPFGPTLFYLRGAAPGGIANAALYRGVAPFVVLQILVLAVIAAVPSILLLD